MASGTSFLLHADGLVLLHLDDNAVVVRGQTDSGATVLRASVGGDMHKRAAIEHAMARVPGVVGLQGVHFSIAGAQLASFFEDGAYDALRSAARHAADASLLTAFARRAAVEPILVTWCNVMDGDLGQLPLAVRAHLRDDVTALLRSVLRTRCYAIHRQFLSHGDLTARNILYTRNGEGQYELRLTDFGEAEFTNNARAVDAEIAAGIEAICTQPSHSRRTALVLSGKRHGRA